jgi:soluble lytic murein transglycosylase-like protein
MQTASDEADAQPEFLALTGYLSRRYRIDTEATGQFVSAARGAGEQFGLDPLLILAVIAIESRFNPIAESVVGAKGLMQIVPDMHPEQPGTLRGAQAMLDPTINIQTGARILSECIDREGSLEGGLQLYNGAASDTSTRYAQKVMAEQERLRQAMRESAHERRG